MEREKETDKQTDGLADRQRQRECTIFYKVICHSVSAVNTLKDQTERCLKTLLVQN